MLHRAVQERRATVFRVREVIERGDEACAEPGRLTAHPRIRVKRQRYCGYAKNAQPLRRRVHLRRNRQRLVGISQHAPIQRQPALAVVEQFPGIGAPVLPELQQQRAVAAQRRKRAIGKQGAEKQLSELAEKAGDFPPPGQGKRLQREIQLERLIGFQPIL